MLLHIPQVLTPEELRTVRATIDAGTWIDGKRTAGTQAVQAKNNEQLSQTSEEARATQAVITRALNRNATFFSAALPKRLYPPQFNRYGGDSNHYGNHVDGAVMYVKGTGERVRSDVSCTLFLADPADYDGGELVIEDTYGNPRIKLAAGDMVLYPSTSVHRVEPVTRGQRLASFFWVESMVRSDEQRRLLYEMDMALLQLRNEHGETDSAVRLSGTYHNLLRMWADT
ncbi:MAG TPA: Fe2+-dependent dioxygenase [Aquabacterium sp.]|uniref:Fe2+-dependent dioxygenase n=1 Tax=Aquabacterium sp. TaxID=1872578 RepID=UPI002E34B84E|nr:Fe2+-dependent dioxygenase [Aquabacterium sp.]HEX5372539.1 Fe2+-dependent dioxygenase [Aquabacterium sp.]